MRPTSHKPQAAATARRCPAVHPLRRCRCRRRPPTADGCGRLPLVVGRWSLVVVVVVIVVIVVVVVGVVVVMVVVVIVVVVVRRRRRRRRRRRSPCVVSCRVAPRRAAPRRVASPSRRAAPSRHAEPPRRRAAPHRRRYDATPPRL